jgi:cell division protein FtsI (penicillin-binding protein 3)
VAANTNRNSANLRLYLLGSILVLWSVGICMRLVYLQVFRYGSFEQKAQHQQQRTEEVSAIRGAIYDRQGRALAMTVSVDSAFAVTSDIPDLATSLSLVSRISKADPHELLARCKAARSFCWVARKADAETADRIRALNLRGIYFQKESKRFYPKRDLGSQFVGYVGTDDQGLSGIEREFNDKLKGEPGSMVISVDAHKKWFGNVEKQPRPGQNLVLTIDEQIQYIAERELAAQMQQTHAEAGTVVVENPHTGEILALANYPTFNPNLSREITPERLKDHAVSDVYEPGSTFKLVTIAAALEEKLTRPSEVFDCQMGSIVVNGMRIHDDKPWGNLSVSEILAHSSEVGAIKIGLRLGDERFYKYIRGFGFGQQTGIELPGETRGLSKPASRWSKVSIAAISTGQEIGVSPLQLAAMVSTIANDGVRLPPRIVAGAIGPQQTPQTVAFHPGEGIRVISSTTAAEMKQMMQGVVLTGTGKKAILEGYSSAGKTGTAQKIDPATHAYSHTKYIASFAGFAPINDPSIVVAVIIDSPVGPHHGADVSAPVFQRISQQVLEYLHTPHDIELPPNRQVLLAARQVNDQDIAEGSPDHLGAPLDEADDNAAVQASAPAMLPSANPVPVKNGGVVQASMREHEPNPPAAPDPQTSASPRPSSGESEASNDRGQRASGTVVLDVEQGGILVPSFIGKTVRTAIETAEESGLDLDAVGSGMGREQSPSPGTHVQTGAKVIVKFGR